METYLSPIQKLQGYRIVNRTLVKPVNPQRLQVLENHAIEKLPPDADSFQKVKAQKKAAVAHYSERTRPIPESKPVEQPSVHVGQSLTPVSETITSSAKPDSPMDSIKNGVPDDQIGNAVSNSNGEIVAVKVENKEEVLNGQPMEIVDRISNAFRAPTDGFFHIVPKGTYSHPSGVEQVLDDHALDTMLANFKAEKSKNPDYAPLVDFDHQSQTGSTEAAGWVRDIVKRHDGLYANVAFSTSGQEAVNGGKFRYVSPVWLRKNCEVVNNDPKMLRPLTLSEVGLTNDNNLPVRALTSISNTQNQIQ